MTPLDTIEQGLLAAGKNVKRRGDVIMAQCPAHDDRTASLSVGVGDTRDVVIHCHARCRNDDVLAAIGLKWSDLGTSTQPDAVYTYSDADGTTLYQVVRKPGKKFLQRQPDGAGGWTWNLRGVDRTLYKLPDVIATAKAGGTIYVCEGEKDVERLVAEGATATCNSGGAGKFDRRLAAHFVGGNVIIVADRDEPGVAHAEEVAKACAEHGVPATIVQAARGKDAADHFTFGGTLDDFVALEAEDNDPTVVTESEDEWPNLVPLAAEPGYPEFPIDALPPWMAETVRSVAADMQCPPDLPAMLGITVLSIACAKHIKVHVRSTWYEQMGTYLVTALEPGENKSPAVKVMIGPVWEYERHLRDSTANERNMAKMRAEYLTGERTKKIRAGEMAEAGSISDEIDALPSTEPPRLIIDDATPGALVQLMAANGERMAIVSSEPAVFSMMKGKFSKDQAADLDVYLKSFSGDSHSEARVTREATPDLVEPSLTIGVTVQPSVLAELMTNSELTDRGLLPRFMVSVPRSLVGTRRMDEAIEIDPAVADTYQRNVARIIETVAKLDGHVVRMSPAAYELFTEARQTLEDARGVNGPMRPIAAWTIKLESTIARVAGMFAVAEHPTHTPNEIGERHMVSALRIADYWIGHAFASFSLATVDPVEHIAKRLSEWLISSGIQRLTLRDAYKMNRRLTPTSADAVAPMQLLVDRHWLRIDDGSTEVLAGRQGQKGQTFTVSEHVATQGAELGTLCAHSGVRLSATWGHCEQSPIRVKKEIPPLSENDNKPPGSAHNVPKLPDPPPTTNRHADLPPADPDVF